MSYGATRCRPLSLPAPCPSCLNGSAPLINLAIPVGRPFSAAHFSGHCFRLIPASCSFVASAFPVPPLHHWVPSHKAATCFGSSSPRFWVPQKNGAEKGDIFQCPTYMLSGIACSAVRSPTVPSLEHG